LNVLELILSSPSPPFLLGQVFPCTQQLKGVWGVAVDPKTNFIYISDTDLHRIHVFNDQRKYEGTQECPLEGTTPAFPRGIVISPNGDFIVACAGVHRISIYRNGVFYKSFGRKGIAVGEFETPLGLACGPQGQIVVVDCKNHRVSIFDEEGRHKKSITRDNLKNTDLGYLHFPANVALYPMPGMEPLLRMFVTNDNHLVQVFDWNTVTNDTKAVFSFGGKGSKDGELFRPSGIAVDPNGYVIVSELGDVEANLGDRVQLFDLKGKFIRRIASRGSGLSHVQSPRAVAINQIGEIFVADFLNKRVMIF